MRYFVAAFPDEATRYALMRHVTALHARAPKARPTQARNLHVTIAFIGPMTKEQVHAVALACDRIDFAPVVWQLDRIGRFPRAGVVWAGGGENAPLLDLIRRMSAQLDEFAIDHDRRAATAHVTLLRNVRDFEDIGPIDPAIRWPIGSIALYGSTHDSLGPVYRRVDAAPTLSA